MQNLASEFSKIFRGWPPPALTLARPLAGRKRPGVGTQNLVPLNFSAVFAPLNVGPFWGPSMCGVITKLLLSIWE